MNQNNVLIKNIEKQITQNWITQKKEFVPGKTVIPLISAAYGKEEVVEAIDSLISTWVTLGKKVKKFENLFAKYIGTKYAIMVNSGSSANLLALSILSHPKNKKIMAGDEIITPAVTWATTVYPMININTKPVFIDVEPDTYTINTKSVKESISNKTAAIMPVHLLGNSCNMEEINKISKKNNLSLIEDSCEAHGAEFKGKKVGSFGDMGTFSFFMSHHITTIEGGMIVTDNEKYYELAKSMRAFGWTRELKKKKEISAKYQSIDERFLFINLGFNLRPTEIQGAFGIHQMKKIKSFLKIRRDNAIFWNKKFKDLDDIFFLPKETQNSKHAHFCYPLTIKDEVKITRSEIVNFLKKKKIETRPIMAGNMVEQPSSKEYKYRISGKLENSERIMKNGFFFGNHQNIGDGEREYVADKILEFVNKKIRK